MAIATTVTRNNFNRGYNGWLNLRVASPAGITAGTVLTIAGDLAMAVNQVMPGNSFNCRITGAARGKGHLMPPGHARLIIRAGDTVTG